MRLNLKNDIKDLIQQNLGKIRPYISENKISAYRLINNTQSFLPVTVEIYNDDAVIHIFSELTPELVIELEQNLKSTLQIENFFYKKNSKDDFVIPASSSKNVIIEEYGRKFLINLSDYLDTGLFLDHRETRKWLAGQCRSKTILNTFAYTGSFTVYASSGGAEKTYSVDISRVYCKWIKDNLALNVLSPDNNWIYKMDTLEFFQYAKKKKLLFDIIIIDPPTFSKNKSKSFSVQRDHPGLINGALGLLDSSGFILFSTNYREFHFTHPLLPNVSIEKFDSVPPDFSGTQPHRCFIIRKRTSLNG